jgi:hypothetical protein
MMVLTSAQTAVESVRVTGHSAGKALSAFVRQAGGFFQDNLPLLVALVVLAIVVFQVTRPRVR